MKEKLLLTALALQLTACASVGNQASQLTETLTRGTNQFDAFQTSAEGYYAAMEQPLAVISDPNKNCPTITIGRQHIPFVAPPEPWFVSLGKTVAMWFGIGYTVEAAGPILTTLGATTINSGGNVTTDAATNAQKWETHPVEVKEVVK